MKRIGMLLGLLTVLMLAGCGDGGTETPQEGTKKELVPEWFLVEQEETFRDDALGTFVAGFNVLEHGADPTGEADNTAVFQQLLDCLGEAGGGSLYVPEGLYRFDGSLTVPKGVTLRGDWKKPEKGKPIEGTVLMAYGGAGLDQQDLPFLTLVLSSGVMDVAIWYPEQDPGHISSYSPAITMGLEGYFGNEYNNVKDVTLVNAYTGIQYSYVNSGAAPVINGVYGTPLKTGIEIDNIADVGRIEHVDFSPAYWEGSGLYGRLGTADPFADQQASDDLAEHLYQNAVGISMRRNDWSYTCYVDVEGYRYGYRAAESIPSPGSTPNGHHYGLRFRNCQTALSIEAGNNVGILFTYVDIEDCANGIEAGSKAVGTAQFQAAEIRAQNRAISMEEQTELKLVLNGCTVESGEVLVAGGILAAADCDFQNLPAGEQADSSGAHVQTRLEGRVNLVGCRFGGGVALAGEVPEDSLVSDADPQLTDLPEYMEVTPQVRLPASRTLYLATEYGAVEGGEEDCTEAVRAALADAAADGGIVFLPPGHYRFEGTLKVPRGVEFRGACDNSAVPHGEGTILEIYGGRGEAQGEPFLQLEAGSGIRGLTLNYPEQIYAEAIKDGEDSYEPIPYPYSIQGQGSDLYIINVGLRASYQGLDLFTYSCDRHYVDFLTGHMFRTGVRIGNCADGTLRNMQCNTIVYAYGRETKFGSFPNSPTEGVANEPVYQYAYYHLDNLILGDCEREFLYNDFNFGALRGILFVNDGAGGPRDGMAIGLGLDQDCQGYYIGDGLVGAGFTFVNTQVVATQMKVETQYIYAGQNSDFKMVVHGGDFWGNPTHFIRMEEGSGQFVLQNARICHPGSSVFAVLEGGTFEMKASSSEKMKRSAKLSSQASLEVRACLLENSRANADNCIWEDNLTVSAPATSYKGGGDADDAS